MEHADFAKRVKARLDELGLNQSRLADMIGRNQSTVSRWLNGAWPEAPQLPALARALEWTVDELLTGRAADAVARTTAGREADRRSRPRGAVPKGRRHA